MALGASGARVALRIVMPTFGLASIAVLGTGARGRDAVAERLSLRR